jgi:hypothetical protein
MSRFGRWFVGGLCLLLRTDRGGEAYGFTEALRRSANACGPHNWQECAWITRMRTRGCAAFSGREVISFQGTAVYELHYSGGMILG